MLVYELWEKNVTYRAVLDCSELLIFPSVLLPNNYQSKFHNILAFDVFL